MKRYYLDTLIGDGSEFNPYRPSVADMGVNHSTVLPPQNPETGKYASTNCLVLIGTANHVPLRGRKGVDPLPDVSLDVRVQAINRAAIQATEQALARRGLPSDLFSGKDGYRDVVEAIGKAIDPGFVVDALDVSE